MLLQDKLSNDERGLCTRPIRGFGKQMYVCVCAKSIYDLDSTRGMDDRGLDALYSQTRGGTWVADDISLNFLRR